MKFWLEIFDGMELVWAAWLVGVAVLAHGLFRTRAAATRPTLTELLGNEEGLSYSMSYIFVVPIYLLFLCVVFESSMLLVAKIGTMYAAHAGARSAVVWQSAQPAELGDKRIRQSVIGAMAPFVSSRKRDISPAVVFTPLSDTALEAAEYAAAYKLYEQTPENPSANRKYKRELAPPSILVTKYLNAASRTTFNVDGDVDVPGGPTTVTVTYSAPLFIPGARRILKPDAIPGFAVYEIRSKATLPNETPESESRTLGIDYQSR